MVSPVLGVVLFYCACSGGMLVINKLAVHHVGAPAFVTLVQFAATVAFVGGGWLGGRISLDAARWSRLRHFVVYVLAFSMGTWANMKVLMTANVETVIVFRSCAPLVCARAFFACGAWHTSRSAAVRADILFFPFSVYLLRRSA